MNKKYQWGIGLEIETFIFYEDKDIYHLVDLKDLYNNRKNVGLKKSDIEFLEKLPHYEAPGNSCVIPPPFGVMIEVVTENPLNKKAEYYTDMFDKYSKRYLLIFNQIYNKLFGDKKLVYPPVSSMYYMDIDKKLKYGEVFTNHVNLTFPWKSSDIDDNVDFYKNYIKQIQWLEPILQSVISSGHVKSYNNNGYIKSGVRSSYGWGLPGSTNPDNYKLGIPKMPALIVPNYVNKLKFKEFIKPYKKCTRTPGFRGWYDNLVVRGLRREWSNLKYKNEGKKTIKSNNFANEIATINRVRFQNLALAKTPEVGYGIEMRFGEFNIDKHLLEMLRFYIYLACNTTSNYSFNKCQENNSWNDSILKSYSHGYKAVFSEEYKKHLKEELGITSSLSGKKNAYQLLDIISNDFHNKFKTHDYISCMLDKNYSNYPKVFNMNKSFIDNKYNKRINSSGDKYKSKFMIPDISVNENKNIKSGKKYKKTKKKRKKKKGKSKKQKRKYRTQKRGKSRKIKSKYRRQKGGESKKSKKSKRKAEGGGRRSPGHAPGLSLHDQRQRDGRRAEAKAAAAAKHNRDMYQQPPPETRRKVETKVYKCPHLYCDFTGKYHDVLKHERDTSMYECEVLGCDFTGNYHDVLKHEKNPDTYYCEIHPDCDFNGKYHDVLKHEMNIS